MQHFQVVLNTVASVAYHLCTADCCFLDTWLKFRPGHVVACRNACVHREGCGCILQEHGSLVKPLSETVMVD